MPTSHRALLSMALLAALAGCRGVDAPAPRTDAPAGEAAASNSAAVPAPVAQPATPAPSTASQPQPQPQPQPEANGDTPVTRFKVVGTEPFWAIDVDGTRLRFSTPEDQAGRALQSERLAYAKGVTFSGKDGGKTFALDIHGGPCSDGMSEEVFEFKASFDYGTRHYKGCAKRAR